MTSLPRPKTAALASLFLALSAADLLVAQSYLSTTIAGGNTIVDGIPANQAYLRYPVAVQTDPAGNVYILDQTDSRVRRIDHATGIITTVAGSGPAAFGGDGGPATSATLNNPKDMAIDRKGLNLYIADSGNYRIRRVNLTTGTITTIAGNGTAGFQGSGNQLLECLLLALPPLQ